MVECYDNKTVVFCYVDLVFLSFWAVSKTTFGFETPCMTQIIAFRDVTAKFYDMGLITVMHLALPAFFSNNSLQFF